MLYIMEIILCRLWKGRRGLLKTQMLCPSEFSFSRKNESGWLFSPAGTCSLIWVEEHWKWGIRLGNGFVMILITAERFLPEEEPIKRLEFLGFWEPGVRAVSTPAQGERIKTLIWSSYLCLKVVLKIGLANGVWSLVVLQKQSIMEKGQNELFREQLLMWRNLWTTHECGWASPGYDEKGSFVLCSLIIPPQNALSQDCNSRKVKCWFGSASDLMS